MKKLLLFNFVLFVFMSMQAQDITLSWVKQLAGPSAAQPNAVCNDGSMATIMAGSFEGVTDFDPSAGSAALSSAGGKDGFICKMDVNGNHAWAVSIGAGQDDIIYDVATDASGNVYAVGEFRGSVDFDPGSGNFTLTAFTGYNGFLIKLNSQGQFQWVAKIAGTGVEKAMNLAVDAGGNVVISGKMYGTTDFANGAPNSTLTGTTNYAFLAKYTSSGSFLWVKGYGGSYTEPTTLKLDDAGNILFVGFFYSQVDFDPGAGNFILNGGYYDTFITKLDPNGTFSWAKSFGGTYYCVSNDIELDSEGNIYLAGYFNGISDFDPDLVNVFNLPYAGNSQNRAFLSKLTPDGLFAWAKNLAQQAISEAKQIEIDEDDNIYVSGYFAGSSDFNPDAPEFPMTSPVTWYDAAFISKFNGNGSFLDAKSFGGTLDVDVDGMDVNPQNGILTLFGNFEGQCNFNVSGGTTTLTSSGLSDMYVARMVQCAPSFASLSASACNNYNLNGFTYTSTGTYTQTLMNSLGCDSTITLNLTIQGITSIQTTYYTTEPVTINGETFNGPGTYTQSLQTINGCDSIVNINLVFLQTTFSVTNTNGTLGSPQQGSTYQWIDCSSNHPINGATGQTFTPQTSGTYAVIVYGNTGSVTSECITVTIISVAESLAGTVSLHPNPSRDMAWLQTDQIWTNGFFVVRDLTGRIVQTEQLFGSNSHMLVVSNWAPGTYILTLYNQEHTHTLKLIKN